MNKPDELATDSAHWSNDSKDTTDFDNEDGTIGRGQELENITGNWSAQNGGTITTHSEDKDTNGVTYFSSDITQWLGTDLSIIKTLYVNSIGVAFTNYGGTVTIAPEEGAYSWDATGSWPYHWEKTSGVKMLFHLGGQALAGQQALVVGPATATEEYPISTNVDFDQITDGQLGQLDTSGLAYKTVANGSPVNVTTQTGVPFYLISTGPGAYRLTHICVADTPTNKDRLTIGVGEKVSLGGMPANTVWSGPGLLLTNNEATFNAPSNACNATVTATAGSAAPETLNFKVLEPAAINMVCYDTNHAYGTAYIAMRTHVYIAPSSVNFGAVSIQELPANWQAGGVYQSLNNSSHGGMVDNPSSGYVLQPLGTLCQGYDESLVSQLGIYNPTNGSGYAFVSITNQWSIDGANWNNFPSTTFESGDSSGAPSHTLIISKCGASASCSVYSSFSY